MVFLKTAFPINQLGKNQLEQSLQHSFPLLDHTTAIPLQILHLALQVHTDYARKLLWNLNLMRDLC